ncbi:LPS translocon maturation chaperone LptM [Dyella sp. KRB-257]|uniref:LPS translocon maturation chaperone LptM n=1 Tax=Dyella sp. KRB-257 TaxID=3400915 RepID=UPI003C0826EB
MRRGYTRRLFDEDLAMRRLLAVMLTVSIACAALAGCGNKGPLVLPAAQPQPPATPANAPAPAPASSAAAPSSQP